MECQIRARDSRPKLNIMGQETLILEKPAIRFKAAVLSMIEDYASAGEVRYQNVLELIQNDFSAYIWRLEERSKGSGVGSGFVPETNFWLVRGGTYVVGTSRLRLQLTPATSREGGHISYDIRPSERRKGYGTLQLALVLVKAREAGLSRALVTCDTDNIASARVIQKNGGVLSGQAVSHVTGKLVSQYWIDLSQGYKDVSKVERTPLPPGQTDK